MTRLVHAAARSLLGPSTPAKEPVTDTQCSSYKHSLNGQWHVNCHPKKTMKCRKSQSLSPWSGAFRAGHQAFAPKLAPEPSLLVQCKYGQALGVFTKDTVLSLPGPPPIHLLCRTVHTDRSMVHVIPPQLSPSSSQRAVESAKVRSVRSPLANPPIVPLPQLYASSSGTVSQTSVGQTAEVRSGGGGPTSLQGTMVLVLVNTLKNLETSRSV